MRQISLFKLSLLLEANVENLPVGCDCVGSVQPALVCRAHLAL